MHRTHAHFLPLSRVPASVRCVFRWPLCSLFPPCPQAGWHFSGSSGSARSPRPESRGALTHRTFSSHPDQVALPDFNAGAMENWGLVTYRENSLLFDPLFSSIGNQERVVTVIAHELAHQVLRLRLPCWPAWQPLPILSGRGLNSLPLRGCQIGIPLGNTTTTPVAYLGRTLWPTRLRLSPVVWEPGDPQMVERPVAERGLRLLRGVSGR